MLGFGLNVDDVKIRKHTELRQSLAIVIQFADPMLSQIARPRFVISIHPCVKSPILL